MRKLSEYSLLKAHIPLNKWQMTNNAWDEEDLGETTNSNIVFLLLPGK